MALAMCSLIDAVTITNFFSDGHYLEVMVTSKNMAICSLLASHGH